MSSGSFRLPLRLVDFLSAGTLGIPLFLVTFVRLSLNFAERNYLKL